MKNLSLIVMILCLLIGLLGNVTATVTASRIVTSLTVAVASAGITLELCRKRKLN